MDQQGDQTEAEANPANQHHRSETGAARFPGLRIELQARMNRRANLLLRLGEPNGLKLLIGIDPQA